MLKNKKLVIINNESVSEKDNKFSCDNIEMKSLPEGLNNFHNLTYIARTSKVKRSHVINVTKIKKGESNDSPFFILYRLVSIPANPLGYMPIPNLQY